MANLFCNMIPIMNRFASIKNRICGSCFYPIFSISLKNSYHGLMSRVLPYLAFAVMLLSSYTAYSQDEIKPIMEQYAPTPKALEQSRYGEISMNHNSGSLGLEIPIGSYTDQDFDIPISLSYSNSGFKPMRPSGEAGLGWSLIAGGSITREINS